MKRMLSNGNWVSQVEDFEQVLNDNDFNALVDIVNAEDKDEYDWKQAYKDEELHSDSLYQRNTNAYRQADEIINYIQGAKRMNRDTLISMLKELQNDLDNY